MSDIKKPTMIIVSDDIRRDSHAALVYFLKVKVIHLYRLARYGDMTKEDFKNTVQYKNSFDLYNKLIELKPDIIQGPEPYASRAAFFNSLAVLKYYQKYKIPFFFPMFENVTAENKFGKILGKFMKWYLSKYAKAAKTIIVLNKGAQMNLRQVHIKSEKIKPMIWGTWGIDEKEFYPNKKIKLKNPTLLFVGRVEAQKGIYTIIRALRLARQNIPNLKLKVVGFGSLVEKISNEPSVEYVGLVKNKNIPKYYQQAWITVSPSIATKIWAEQVGMVNIQSIACGTPIISTYSGAIPQYIPDKKVGILIKEGDYKILAKNIEKLILNDKLREKLSNQGVEYAKKHYLVCDNIKKGEEFVLELLKDNYVGKNR